MDINLLYSTPEYHKLVEFCARRCYDSFSKCGDNSHSFIRGIMKKGHLSIAGHGNIVLTIDNVIDTVSEHDILDSLVTFKEINNYIRWSRDDESKWDWVISMNILTYLDIFYALQNNEESFAHFSRARSGKLFTAITEAILNVPSLRWFSDADYQIEGSPNPYLHHSTDLLKPSILTSDYLPLHAAGLTEYELDMHTTISVEITSDRAMSLQDARHTDMMARSEISQRYVTMSDFKYRVPNGLEKDSVVDSYNELDKFDEILNISVTYADIMREIAEYYDVIREYAEKSLGANQLRAKEIARSVLPNATYSTYIDSRPLRQWKHFFNLRDDKHAQNEKQDDAVALLHAFRGVGIPV